MIPKQQNDTTLNMQSMTPVQKDPVPSPFSNHLLQPRSFVPVVHKPEHPDWVFGVARATFK